MSDVPAQSDAVRRALALGRLASAFPGLKVLPDLRFQPGPRKDCFRCHKPAAYRDINNRAWHQHCAGWDPTTSLDGQVAM